MSDTKERVLEWLTGADTCYLIGAGCSRCAGKPLIGDLTANVLKRVDASIKEQFEGLKASGSRAPTIEDLINYLVRYESILATVKDTSKHPLQPGWIETSLDAIKKEIVADIVDNWAASAVHARFFQRLSGRQRGRPRDLFILNYDTVVEATLDSLRLCYLDGFRGGYNAWFDPSVFEDVPTGRTFFRLHKLHGSINWLREETGHVRRAIVRSKDDITLPVVVYPSEQKYLQSQYGIYETLIGLFRTRMREPAVNNCLITLGYSFNDEHLNEAICDAIAAAGSNLTVIAFIGPDADLPGQKKRLQEIAARSDSRFNAYVGKDFYIGSALDDTAAQLLLKEELWQFEKLVDFVAGEPT